MDPGNLSREEKLRALDLIEEKRKRLRESRTLYHPNAGQMVVHRSTASLRCAFSGNGAGKTCMGANEALWAATGYNPILDTWQPTSTIGAPSPRVYHRAVWAGSSMIVWGGWLGPFDGQSYDNGGRYDPVTDTWQPTSTVGAPHSRGNHA